MFGRALCAWPPWALRLPCLGLLFVLLSSCYVTRQAWHQNNLFNSRRKVAAVLADPKTPETTRKKLKLSREILAFATRSGLNAAGAYTYFIETDEPVVSYLVQAAPADSLTAVTWWFPIIGRVPYMGFFSRVERDDKAEKLRAAGYDVYSSGVGAFSSLGWFEDPIFSSMLRRDEAELANLLLHELTHRTLWIAGSTDFNENLAEYTADVLTIEYLKSKSLPNALATYVARRQDQELFKSWLRQLKQELTTLYEKPPQHKEKLLAAKADIFLRYMQSPLKPNFKSTDFVGSRADWNNATVLGASLYSPDTEKFSEAMRCVGGQVKDFLEALRQAAERTDDGFAALAALCGRGRHVD